VQRMLLATCTAIAITVGVPVAGADTFILGGTNGVGGPPSQQEMQGLVEQGLIPSDTLIGIDYPAQLWPFAGTMTLDASVRQGTDALDSFVRHSSGPITVVGTSQGAVVINYEKRRLMAQADRPDDITFVTIGDPTNSDGGLFAKIPRVYIPVLDLTITGPPPETAYDTVEIVREYDGYADFPDRPLNVLADLNALAGTVYIHSDYSGVDLDNPANVVTENKNSLGGTTTHILAPTKNLPLTQPLRDLGVDDDVVDAIDKPLRKVINTAYEGERPGRPQRADPLRKLRSPIDVRQRQSESGKQLAAERKPVAEHGRVGAGGLLGHRRKISGAARGSEES
jgi:hypothetical protein